MANLLVHLVTGPENPSRAALALLVARAAVDAGHAVRVFLAGDAVQLVRPETASATQGVGTGSFAEHWDALVAADVPILFSRLSANARGVDADLRAGQVEAAAPAQLVDSAVWADTTLTY